MPVARYSENTGDDENAGNKDTCSSICCWTSAGDAQGDYPTCEIYKSTCSYLENTQPCPKSS